MKQDNLLSGIDNCSSAARYVVQVQVHSKTLDNSFSIIFSSFQQEVTIKVGHGKKSKESCQIFLKYYSLTVTNGNTFSLQFLRLLNNCAESIYKMQKS